MRSSPPASSRSAPTATPTGSPTPRSSASRRSSSRSAPTPSREEWGDALLEQIAQWEADVVILSGFMRLLPAAVVDALTPAAAEHAPGVPARVPRRSRGARRAGRRRDRDRRERDHRRSRRRQRARRGAAARSPCSPGDTEGRLHDRIKLVERELLVQVVLDIANDHLDLKETRMSAPAPIRRLPRARRHPRPPRTHLGVRQDRAARARRDARAAGGRDRVDRIDREAHRRRRAPGDRGAAR